MLRKETVEPPTLELLKKIVSLDELKQYRLVGGTALSLLLGHRKSIDLDLFTDKPIDKEVLLNTLIDNFGDIVVMNDRSKSIFQCLIQNTKVDFVSVRDPFLHPVNFIEDIPFADIKDLIALKLNAVKGRGVKKDFWDIVKLLEVYTMTDLFQFYHDRYPYDDSLAIHRAMVYFNDAENQPEPESLDNMTWQNAKKIIIKALDVHYKNK